MAWDRRPGTRRNLPKDWPARRQACKKAAGGRCEKIMPSGRRCPRQGSEADHIGDPDDHSPENLRWLCEAHHKEHTQKQAQAARRKASGKPAPKPPRPHPGRLR